MELRTDKTDQGKAVLFQENTNLKRKVAGRYSVQVKTQTEVDKNRSKKRRAVAIELN